MNTIPQKLIDLLNQHHVHYEVLHHPARYTAQELAEVEGIKGRSHAKVVMIQKGGAHFMTVLPSDRRVDMRKLEALAGGGARIEDEDDFKSLFPDCDPGAMPPFGSIYHLSTLVDESLTKNDIIAFEAGTHTDAIRMKYRDYASIEKPQVASFTM